MTTYNCQRRCDGWHNLINFIHGVPFYALADKCNTCNIWFPKYHLNTCPCCNVRLRSRRSRCKKGQIKLRDRDKDPIREKIQERMAAGWTLLNEDIWRRILDYQLITSPPSQPNN